MGQDPHLQGARDAGDSRPGTDERRQRGALLV